MGLMSRYGWLGCLSELKICEEPFMESEIKIENYDFNLKIDEMIVNITVIILWDDS